MIPDLDAIRAALVRATSATSGEWEMESTRFGSWQVTAPSSDEHPDYRRRVADSMTEPDAELVANAPEWLAALCDEIERLSRRLGMTRDNAADDLAELRDENARLRDVAVAARRLLEDCGYTVDIHGHTGEVAVLESALDALDAGGE